MKFRFEDQPHQAAAIVAVTDLFEGALRPPVSTVIGQAPGSAGHAGFVLDTELLADNLGVITERERVGRQSALALLAADDFRGQRRSFANFSVEMETGTGKTYVYIATALRLAELYGLRKFVILVHSTAIRAGAVKTFEQTTEHFRVKYPAVTYRWGVLGEGPALDDFTEPSATVRFLVASVQAIDKPDSNSVYQQLEQPRLWTDSMSAIAAIAAARPVVVVDEPQNMATALRRKAIATLNPLVALRYSATHRESFNLVHRLGPKAASEAGLVKRVSVKGIVAGGSAEPYLMVKRLRSVRRRTMADVVIERATEGGTTRVVAVLREGSDLFDESAGLDVYRGMVVESCERRPDRIRFDNGRELRVGQEIGVDRAALWRDQIRHTVRQHLARQRLLDVSGRHVKVLSLFFVEHVADYVGVEHVADYVGVEHVADYVGVEHVADYVAVDGQEPVLPAMFDELFRQEWVRAGKGLAECPDPATVRVHYFPSTRSGRYRDTRGTATDAEYETRAYEEIIANKEALLTRDNPRAFIFSHSALKEGWDNPNVFQVGFLRHSRSDLERRQQIGRGLRLPVDESGRRVADPDTCRLTLVVDESFAEFRDGLNREYVAAGSGNGEGGGGPEPDDADADKDADADIDVDAGVGAGVDVTEFAQLWGRIRDNARYRMGLDPSVLPAAVARSAHLDQVADLPWRANVVQAADLTYDDRGRVITGDPVVSDSRGESLTVAGRRLPDLVRLVDDQLLAGRYPLQLTRPTLGAILAALPPRVTRRAIDDPDRWARLVAAAVRAVTTEEMVEAAG